MKRILVFILIVIDIGIFVFIPSSTSSALGSKMVDYLYPTVITPSPVAVPMLTPNGTTPQVKAKAAYLLDTDTNHVLLDLNGTKRLPMASTTKIMTAIIALESVNPDQMVTVKQDAVDEVTKNQGSTASLIVGDQIPMKYMLYALMLPSGDDAAVAIADSISGSPESFVNLMNSYAKKLHLLNTHYVNPDGLTNTTDSEYTTAADLASLTRYAMANEQFSLIIRTQHFQIDATDTHAAYTWDTTDTLLSTYISSTGVKTGYTGEAGYCLVFSATKSHHHLIGVVLNEAAPDDRFTDAQKILDWGFALPLKLSYVK